MLRFYFVIITSPLYIFTMIRRANHYIKHPQKYTEARRYALAQEVMHHIRRRSRTQTVYTGEENLPKEGGYIMYANHQGKYDALGIMLCHKSPSSVLMEKIQSERIIVSQLIDLVMGKRLDFQDPRQQLRVLQEISQEVAAGRKFLIFPEGGYTDNKNQLQKFNAGCMRCSLESRTPIVPVAIVDSYKALNSSSLKRCTTQVHFLPAIPYEAYKDMKKTEISEMVKTLIQQKLDEVIPSDSNQTAESLGD